MLMSDTAAAPSGHGDFVVIVQLTRIFSPSAPFIIFMLHTGRREVIQQKNMKFCYKKAANIRKRKGDLFLRFRHSVGGGRVMKLKKGGGLVTGNEEGGEKRLERTTPGACFSDTYSGWSER